MSKLLFMCPDKRIVEKSFLISSKIWEIYSAILGKKRDLHSVLSKTALSVWREILTEVPSDFFQFSAGSTKWTLALRRKISSKKTFHEKKNYFYRFRTLTELHLRVQRKVLFRNTVLDLFLSGHDFKPKVFKFGGISLNFSFETAFYVNTRTFVTFERMFSSGKSTHLFISLKFWAKTFD